MIEHQSWKLWEKVTQMKRSLGAWFWIAEFTGYNSEEDGARGGWELQEKKFWREYSLEGLMLKPKLQYFGHPLWRTDSLEKTLMLGKMEGRRRRGRQRPRWMDGISNSMDVSLSKLWEMVKDREAWHGSPWVAKSQTRLSNRTTTIFSSGQLLSRVRLFATPWTAARQASLSITISRSSLRRTSIELVMPPSHLILCRPLSLLPSNCINLSLNKLFMICLSN